MYNLSRPRAHAAQSVLSVAQEDADILYYHSSELAGNCTDRSAAAGPNGILHDQFVFVLAVPAHHDRQLDHDDLLVEEDRCAAQGHRRSPASLLRALLWLHRRLLREQSSNDICRSQSRSSAVRDAAGLLLPRKSDE